MGAEDDILEETSFNKKFWLISTWLGRIYPKLKQQKIIILQIKLESKIFPFFQFFFNFQCKSGSWRYCSRVLRFCTWFFGRHAHIFHTTQNMYSKNVKKRSTLIYTMNQKYNHIKIIRNNYYYSTIYDCSLGWIVFSRFLNIYFG